jgi:hypothetical protein
VCLVPSTDGSIRISGVIGTDGAIDGNLPGMKRRPRRFPAEDAGGAPPPPDAEAVLQIKVWLIGISPTIRRCVLVPAAVTLRELHGVIQVAIGWEGFHLFQFCLRAVRYGSAELSTSSPDVTLAALGLRKGARFIYEYDLNIPRRHEVRIEDRLAPAAGKTFPICAAGDGACPPEDCGGPDAFVAHRDDILSRDSRDELATMAEIIGDITRERRLEILDDAEVRWRMERAVERSQARERAQGKKFSRRTVNGRLGEGAHSEFMHQQSW